MREEFKNKSPAFSFICGRSVQTIEIEKDENYLDDLTSTSKMKTISWPVLTLMALCTVIGLDDIMYNFQTFSNEGGGLSSWVRGTDGEFLGYFTAWTYWAASIPYAVDSANEIIVDLGWALTGSKGFQDKIPTTMFAALTFVVFIVFIIVEHHFANSMEFLSSIGGGLMVIMTVLFVLLAFVMP